MSAQAFPEFPSVPEAVATFHQNGGPGRPTPYFVTNIAAFADHLDVRHDIVCPFVGITSAGKTSLLKALFNLDPSDDLLQVRATMDTTRVPTVLLWRVLGSGENVVRLWLMDLPGVDAASDIPGQLRRLSTVVQAAAFVARSNPTDEGRSLFERTVAALDDRVFLVYNSHSMTFRTAERESLMNEARSYYTPLFHNAAQANSTQELQIVLTRVERAPGAPPNFREHEFGIDQLERLLEEWLQHRRSEIEQAIVRARGYDGVDVAQGAFGATAVGVALLPAAAELVATGSLAIAGAATVGPIAAAAALTGILGWGLRRVWPR